MDILDKIYDKVMCELEDITKQQKLTAQDVELIDKFVDIIKDIDEMGMPQDMGASFAYDGASYANGGMYARGGGRSGRNSYGMNRSYMYGRSMDSRDDSKRRMLDELTHIADMAVDDKDRKAIERLMEQMRNA